MDHSIILRTQYLVSLSGEVNELGVLHFWEDSELFPNGIQRCFWITQIAAGETRGNHAHWKEFQVLVALAGKVQIEVLSAAGDSYLFDLNSAVMGLLVPPLHWVVVRIGSDSVLLGMSDQQFS
jgi:dTDP-4-dehydrorhamnose 3,5-epimerase